MVDYILGLVVIFENYFLIGIFQSLCFHKVKRKDTLLMTFVLTIEAFLLTYFMIGQLPKMFLLVVTLFIYSICVNRTNILQSLVCIGISLINLLVSKSLIILIVTCFVNVNFSDVSMNYAIMFIMTCLSIMVLSLEYFYLRYFIELKVSLSKISMGILVIYLILVLCTICYVFHEFIYNDLPWEMCCYLTIASIIVLYLAVYLTISNSQYYQKNLEQSLKLESYEFEDKYIDVITEKTIEYNKLNHDMKHHINVINSLIKDSHIEEVKDYIDDISLEKTDNYIHVNHLVLNYILNNKTAFAKNQGIAMSCLVNGQPVTFISDVDYSILVSNLLDNAIEATLEAKGDEISVALSFQENKFIIEVRNSTVIKPKGKQLLTNKKDKQQHGIGLKNIKTVVDKYDGEDSIEIHDNVFYHRCILYRMDEI